MKRAISESQHSQDSGQLGLTLFDLNLTIHFDILWHKAQCFDFFPSA